MLCFPSPGPVTTQSILVVTHNWGGAGGGKRWIDTVTKSIISLNVMIWIGIQTRFLN